MANPRITKNGSLDKRNSCSPRIGRQIPLEEMVPGLKKGWLTIDKEISKRSCGRTMRYVVCTCKCGNKVERGLSGFLRTENPSCGCYMPTRNGIASMTHGECRGSSASVEYSTYCAMKNRCLTPTSHAYKNYGGRGIKICKRWLESFDNFLSDMGRRPSPDLSLDRINPNGNYEPSNCRWADKKTQGKNRRTTRWLSVSGKNYTAKDFSQKTGVSSRFAAKMISEGKSGDEIVAMVCEALEKLKNT